MSGPSRSGSRQCCGLAVLLLACTAPASSEHESETGGESGVTSETDGETGDEPGCADPPILPDVSSDPIPWVTVGEFDIADDGSTTRISVNLPADARYLALRSVTLDGEDADNHQICHDLLEARLVDADVSLFPADGQPLADTDQRRVPGPSAGVFVFSSAVEPLVPAGVADTLELRVQMRHCYGGSKASRAFFPGMATRVRVDAASEPGWSTPPSPATPARLAVRLLIAEDSGWGPIAEDAELAEAWAVAVDRFAAADVELVLEAEGTLPAVGELDYDAAMLALHPLHDDALACLRSDGGDHRFVPVVLVPCLRLAEPGSSSIHLGQTPHVPGLFDDDTSPSLVVIASGSCNLDSNTPAPSRDPERHGVILAHEIGHYLGLHHSDSELGQHLATGADAALMDSSIAQTVDPQSAWFSLPQIDVLLRHPAVRLP